jgi:hypothetical protein
LAMSAALMPAAIACAEVGTGYFQLDLGPLE